MKTLSEALQLQIIEHAGTTFRSVVLAQLKDNVGRSECVVDAHKITQFFIDMMTNNLVAQPEEKPPILDTLHIVGVQNGS